MELVTLNTVNVILAHIKNNDLEIVRIMRTLNIPLENWQSVILEIRLFNLWK